MTEKVFDEKLRSYSHSTVMFLFLGVVSKVLGRVHWLRQMV